MSRLSPESLLAHLIPERTVLRAYIAPGRVLLRASGRNVPQKLVEARFEASAAGDWSSLLAALRGALADPAAKAIGIVLSDHYFRHFCIPGRQDLEDEAELRQYAALKFEDIHGPGTAADWNFAVSDTLPGNALFCSALPAGLAEGLAGLCEEAGLRLDSIRPRIVAAAQSYPLRWPESGWLVSQEAERISFAAWNGEGYHTVISCARSFRRPEELLDQLRYEMTLAGVSPSANGEPIPVYICSSQWPMQAWPEVPGLSIACWNDALPRNPQGAADVDLFLLGVKA